jgi:hypothetical protein
MATHLKVETKMNMMIDIGMNKILMEKIQMLELIFFMRNSKAKTKFYKKLKYENPRKMI